MKRLLLKQIFYGTALSLATLLPSNTQDTFLDKKESFSIEKYLVERFDEKKYYFNPFKDISGNEVSFNYKNSQLSNMLNDSIITSKPQTIDSIIDNYLINNSAANLIDATSSEALKIFLHEKEVLKKHHILLSLLSEWLSEKDTIKLNRNNIFREKYNIPLSNSIFYRNLPKYDPKNENYALEKVQLLKELDYYGSNIDNKTNPAKKAALSLASMNELRKNNLEPTDCISFILECLTNSTNKNYFRRSLSNAEGFGDYFRNKGFESIFIASNTNVKDERYKYNSAFSSGFYTKEVFSEVKNRCYYVPIDYVVTDNDFYSPAFKDFIKNTSGFLLIQEGYHSGLLVNGNMIDARYNASPLYSPVFTSSDFIKKFDNDNPKNDYQATVLLVPKGTVKAFLVKNQDIIVKEPNFYERYLEKQRLLDDFLKLDIDK